MRPTCKEIASKISSAVSQRNLFSTVSPLLLSGDTSLLSATSVAAAELSSLPGPPPPPPNFCLFPSLPFFLICPLREKDKKLLLLPSCGLQLVSGSSRVFSP